MTISHVIRGEDHLPNTPKYLLVWDALGYGEHPVFAHLPMIVNEKRQKLRSDATQSHSSSTATRVTCAR